MTDTKHYIAGIDPGLEGGIALYNSDNLLAYRTPTVITKFIKKGKKSERKDMDVLKCKEILDAATITHVFIEKVSALPGQGVTGMFRFGQNFGQWEGLVIGLGIEYTLVRPQLWKKHLNLIGAQKHNSVELAKEIFPNNVTDFKYKTADEGRAEASLIAKYGWDQLHDSHN